jgi:hypothetical protein
VREVRVLLVFAWLALMSSPGFAAPNCAATLSELRVMLDDANFPLLWEETTMDDAKPLRVSILEKEGVLILEFVKTGKGLWAQSEGVFCKVGADVEVRFTAQQIRMGPAANWLLRMTLGHGGVFKLSRPAADQLHIATRGWSGTFSPQAK